MTEFEQRLKATSCDMTNFCDDLVRVVAVNAIDQIAKEMKEGVNK
jgi:hypothetical protein